MTETNERAVRVRISATNSEEVATLLGPIPGQPERVYIREKGGQVWAIPAVDVLGDATPEKPALRIVAEYQMMGDMEGHEWAELVLSEARHKGLITDYEVLGAFQVKWGIWLILFVVDVLVSDGVHESEPPRFHDGQSWEEAEEAASNLLNGPVIQDSDVQVRGISPTVVREEV